MQKKFITNLILIVLLNLLVKPAAIFGIDATIQNRVGAEEYGLYFSLLNLSFLFNILLDLGINNFTTKQIAQFPNIASGYINKVFTIRLLLFVLYAIITFLIGFFIGYRGIELTILMLLILNQFLITLIAYFRSHFSGLHLFKTDAAISIMDRLLLIVLCINLLFFNKESHVIDIVWFVQMQTISYGLTLIMAILLLYPHVGKLNFSFNWLFSLVILKKSYRYALLVLLMMIYTRIDSVMLERIHVNGSYEAGIYAQGYRLLDAFFMFGMIFANLLLPMFSRILKHESHTVYPLLITARNLLIGGAILIAIICFSNGTVIFNVLYHHYTMKSISSFYWLMASFVSMCIILIYGTLLTANGNMQTLIKLSFTGILINIAFNLLLIPKYGALGSSISFFITQTFIACAQIYLTHFRLFPFKFSRKQFVNFFGYLTSLFVISEVSKTLEYKLFIELLCGMLLMFIFKMIDFKNLKNIFNDNL